MRINNVERRWLLSAVLILIFSGCDTGFRDEKEELSYLSSLSNPTPQQWRRRNELMKKFLDETEAWDKKFAAQVAADVKQHEIEDAQKELVGSMKRAARYEGNGDWKTARNNYRYVVENHPNTPEARKADEALKRIEKGQAHYTSSDRWCATPPAGYDRRLVAA